VRIEGPAERIRAELKGMLREHPACPRVLDFGPDWMLLEPLGPPPADPLAAVMAWPAATVTSVVAPLREHLSARTGVVNPEKALRKLGLKKCSRKLARPLRAPWTRGPGLGGVHEGWLRTAGDRVVSLRWSRAAQDGWPAMDWAATAWFLEQDVPAEWDLDLLRVLLDEAVLGRNPRAAEDALRCVERLVPAGEPTEVRIDVEGPPWLDVSSWTGVFSPVEARRLLRLDGTEIGGEPLRVHADPPLRVGSRPQPRAPRAVRNQRLFSRWNQGVQVDDEGLYSLTPEALAMRATRGCSGRVLDATCGLGGLAIALARRGCSVVACDLSERRIAMARHNASLYGADIDFRLQDARTVKGDFDHVVIDPPWGGRDYGALTLKDLPLAEALLERAPSVHLKLPVSFRIKSLPRVRRVQPMMDDRLRFLWVTC